jgi:hypothetical protein
MIVSGLAYANKALAELNKAAAESREYQADPVVAHGVRIVATGSG